jgi:hypothetical protein
MRFGKSKSVAAWQRGTKRHGQVIEKTGVYLSLSGVSLAHAARLSKAGLQ